MNLKLQLGVSSLVVKVSKFLVVAERGSLGYASAKLAQWCRQVWHGVEKTSVHTSWTGGRRLLVKPWWWKPWEKQKPS